MKTQEREIIAKVTNMLSNIKQDDPDFETKMIDCQEVLYWLRMRGEETAKYELEKVAKQDRWKK